MNEYSSDEAESPPARPPKPSMAPSWVMLGFVFGALFIWALPHHEVRPTAIAVTPRLAAREPIVARRLTEVENVFAEYGHYAVWENERTEFALWNGREMSFSDAYEVMRSGETLYFRSIPKLTRPLQLRELPTSCPAQFTETQAQHDQQIRERTERTFQAISEAARQNIPAPDPKPLELQK